MTKKRQRSHADHARLHVCGRVPLDGPEAVFREVSGVLAPYVERIPDGQVASTGEAGAAPRFREHPNLEVVPGGLSDKVGESGGNGVMVRPRPGADPASIGFGPIGYAEAARESWRVFRRLREEGVIASGGRFQVNLPTPLTLIATHVAEGHAELEPAYEAALLGEVDEITATVPHESLAVEWDAAVELAILDGTRSAWFDDRESGVVSRLLRLGGFVPDDVPMGYHLCSADAAGQALPVDPAVLVEIANRLGAGLPRTLNWLHLPAPHGGVDGDLPGEATARGLDEGRSDGPDGGRVDGLDAGPGSGPDAGRDERADRGAGEAADAYFAALAGLRLPAKTALYLELVDVAEGPSAARRRIDAATRMRRPFGIAVACGRDGWTAEQARELLRAQAELVGALPGARS